MWKAYETINFPERLLPNFWKRVDKSGDCWLWTGRLRHDKYGQYSWRHDGVVRTTTPHRISYSIVVGDIPASLQLDHLCRVKLCVNPSHLEAVTARVNTLRSTSQSAQNAAKTHCQKGHPLDGIERDGHRFCKTCSYANHREWNYRRNEKAGKPNLPKSSDRQACPRGHPYSGVSKAGTRICTPCNNAKSAAYHERKRIAEGRPKILKASDRQQCPQGHEYSGISKQGKRICRLCNAAKTARYKARKRAASLGQQ